MTHGPSDETNRNGTPKLLLAAAFGLVLIAPTAAAGGIADDARTRTVVVTPSEGSEVMTYSIQVPLDDPEAGADGPTSTCGATGTGTCTGLSWTLHGQTLEYETSVFVGTVGQTTNRVTGLDGPSAGNVWENHCDWYAVFGLCTFHTHGRLFIGDDAQHSGSATYDACVPTLCDWTVEVQNTH